MRRSQSRPFHKFTQRAQRVMQLAQREAQRLNHNYIGTEHILLGLVGEGEGIAARALQSLGIELNAVRQAVEGIIGRGDRVVLGEIGMTPRAKRVIELALDEAQRWNHHFIGTEHLLLGLIREGEGIGANVLESLGISLERARTEVIRVLTQSSGDKAAAEAPAPKSNVVTCRLDDAALGALDALVEAGIRSTRSDAAAWLIGAGIEAHRELFDRVNSTVNEIRKLRLEARDIARQVASGANGGPETGGEDDDKPAADDAEDEEQGEIPDPEEPDDLDDLGKLDEPPAP